VWGKCYIKNVFDLPSKKLSLQKIFGSNLSLHTREARGVAQPQWASLREAQNNFDISSPVLPIAQLYCVLRTHFSRK
jgi:hypothetical protein